MTSVLLAALGYLLGSIPFGLLLTRLAGLGDIRAIGSGNIGATNVLRTGKKRLAAATLALDALKGAVAVWIAATIAGEGAAILAGLAALVGHIFPVWLHFKGGKGVATALGVFLALAPLAGLATCAAWLLAAKITRRSSAAALTALAISPLLALGFGASGPVALAFLATALLVAARHRENIERLIAGTEPRIGESAS